MALLVWLPLRGDVNNYGLSRAKFYVTDTTTITQNLNGKIGSCYSFSGYTGTGIRLDTGSMSVANFMTELIDNKSFSIACWVYPTVSGQTAICTLTYSIRFLSNQFFGLNYSALPQNQWSHVVGTWNTDTLERKVYINGVEVASGVRSSTFVHQYTNSICVGRDSNNSVAQNAYFLLGLMNDFRIYDHCLSPKEVKEISQGLILNYKLDYKNPNLFLQTPKSITPTSYCAYLLNLSENLVAGLTYTMLLWNVDIAGSAPTRLMVYWGGGSVSLFSWYVSSDFTNGHADHLVKTFTVTSNLASGSGASNLWLNLYNYPSSSTNKNVSIGAWKIEKGSVATPLTYNEDSGIIYDTSGYLNNGEAIGSIEASSDTPRYLNSTYFNGASYISRTSPSTEASTISLWVNWSSIPSVCAIFMDYKSKIGFGLASNGILCSCSGTSTYTFNKANLIANTWYHFVIVKPSASKRELYINGIKLTPLSATNVWDFTLDQLQVGKRSTTSNGFNGQLSDFRIYSTVLSDDDILDLYKVGASVDDLLNFYAYEILENGNLQILPKTNISLTGYSSYYSPYLSISPGVYDYDITYEATGSDNYNLIGFERWDANKTSTSNYGCRYVHSTTGASSKTRIFGTVNLTKALNSNPVAFTRLRVLNDWNNKNTTNSLTIYSISLRQSDTHTPLLILHTGEAICNEFQELDNTSIRSNGITETNNIYEI